MPAPLSTHNKSTTYVLQHEPEIFADRWTPRIMLVRNPYGRLYSGYSYVRQLQSPNRSKNDQLIGAKIAPKGWKAGGSFATFVKLVLATPVGHLDMHILPQRLMCQLPPGMQMDFILKLEDIDDWYAPLVELLGLQRAVSSGWLREFGGKQSCMYTTSGIPCEAMLKHVPSVEHARDADEGIDGDPTTPESLHLHASPSIGRHESLTKAYSKLSPAIMERLQKWLEPELSAFRYPRWNVTGQLCGWPCTSNITQIQLTSATIIQSRSGPGSGFLVKP